MTANETASVIFSALALGISGLTAWLTLLKRGAVGMTQPTVVYFGPDADSLTDGPRNKIYLRTLLYATSRRGRIIESMFARLKCGESSQTFNVWVYGEERLTRGSGLFIPNEGVATNHHFLLPFDGTTFQFPPGTYTLDVFASLLGDNDKHRLLHSIKLHVSAQQSARLTIPRNGLYFDWGPDSATYHSHIR
jgi:hypothetical protein